MTLATWFYDHYEQGIGSIRPKAKPKKDRAPIAKVEGFAKGMHNDQVAARVSSATPSLATPFFIGFYEDKLKRPGTGPNRCGVKEGA